MVWIICCFSVASAILGFSSISLAVSRVVMSSMSVSICCFTSLYLLPSSWMVLPSSKRATRVAVDSSVMTRTGGALIEAEKKLVGPKSSLHRR